jgi:hypothetical protein
MSRGNCLVLLVVFAAFVSPSVAQLVDFGPAGEYFYDSSTSLYWYDPAQFVGQSRAMIDAFVQGSPIWQWATSGQIDALNGKSAPVGQALETVMGPRQFSLTNGGPRWIGYHASASAPDGWLAQSFNSPGFTTIDATGFQNNVITWGPGAWLVSTVLPTLSLTLTQPQGSGSLLIQVSGPPNANYFTAISFDTANSTAPGSGWWQGLHISFLDLVLEVNTGAPPFLGILDSTGLASFALPSGSLPPLPEAFAVTTFFDSTWTTLLGATGIESIVVQ